LISGLPCAVSRIAIASSIHPRRAYNDRQNQINQKAYQETVEASIAAEKRWLDGAEGETSLAGIAWVAIAAAPWNPHRKMD